MRTWPAVLLIVSGCAAPAPPPGAVERSVAGVTVFEGAGGGSDALIVQDAIEWRGRFAVGSKCLVLSIDDKDYTPVFGNRPALQAALGDLGSGSPRLGASSWSLQGSRVPEVGKDGYANVLRACGKPSFLVSDLSDPRPLPAAPPAR